MSDVRDMVQWDPRSEWRSALLYGSVFTVLFVALVTLGGPKPGAVLLLPGLALILLLIANVPIALAGLVVVLYIVYPISLFTSAVWFASVVALALVVNYRDFAWKDFSTPLTVPLIIFGLSVLPSLVNAGNPWMCLARFFNVFAFLSALYATYMGVRSRETLRNLVWVYVAMALINGGSVIFSALVTGKRQYGFAGVMYVDYAGLSVCVLATIAMLRKGWQRVAALSALFFIGIALVLTQTRNAWIATLLTMMIAVGFLLRYPFLVGISRRRLIRYTVVGGILIALVAAGALLVNPKVEERAAGLAEIDPEDVGETIIIQNSLVTRMMIWTTALNGIQAHPWVGVGIYGFSQTSKRYSRLPDVFYYRYVRGMGPHVTYLSVLVEAGIVGLTGFFIFLGTIIRVALRGVHQARSVRAQQYAVVGLVAMTYVTVSMFFTDAWLWGQGAVLWGLIVGMILVNQKINEPADEMPARVALQESTG
jgi:O-antigen ligase